MLWPCVHEVELFGARAGFETGCRMSSPPSGVPRSLFCARCSGDPMSRVFSSEALEAFYRRDAKVLAEYFRELSRTLLVSALRSKNVLAAHEDRTQAALYDAVARALDHPKASGAHWRLVFQRKRRPSGRPRDEGKNERHRKIVDTVIAIKQSKFDAADALRAQGKKPMRRMVSNLTDDFKQAAKQTGSSVHTVKAVWNASPIGSKLKKRSRGRNQR